MVDIMTRINEKTRFHPMPDGGPASPEGFAAGGLHCGIKRKRPDLGWIYSEVPAAAAAVYTTNRFQAAPLRVTQDSLAVEGKLQAVLVNSGIANACTGEKGLADAYAMRRLFAERIGIPNHFVAVASTGVIGEPLPMANIQIGISKIHPAAADPDLFNRAILTTDTVTKHVAARTTIGGRTVTIGGAAKGSGMIHPNMATMLAFLTTDAAVEGAALQNALKAVTEETFNMITVDGDTSTNDMVILMANGRAGHAPIAPGHADWPAFMETLKFVCRTLAKAIARDGEGATKLIEVDVQGAPSHEAAKAIAKSVVGSNLVKTAICGADANWGRIVCAVGYSGCPVDLNKLTVAFGSVTVLKNGTPLPFDEAAAETVLSGETVPIHIKLGDGEGCAVAWGCDLTADYVKINASYRT